ncbi:MAG: hypothetical protein ABI550_06385, partial [Ignavibacteriaceae bacterium]
SESDKNYQEGYYIDQYYGGYGYYYDYPWWLTIIPPSVNEERKADRDKTQTGSIRNNDGERGSTPRGSGNSNGDVNNSSNPSRNEGNGGSSGNNSSGSSSSNTSTEKARSSSNDSGNSSSTPKSTSSSSDNKTRNNDGSRNSTGRK